MTSQDNPLVNAYACLTVASWMHEVRFSGKDASLERKIALCEMGVLCDEQHAWQIRREHIEHAAKATHDALITLGYKREEFELGSPGRGTIDRVVLYYNMIGNKIHKNSQ